MPYAFANAHNIVSGKNFRITVIAERFIRFEWNAENIFEDRKSLAVINRDLGKKDFSVSRTAETTVIDTGRYGYGKLF